MKTLYETTVINTGGRQGIVQSPDNVFMLDVATPRTWRSSHNSD